MSELQPTAKSHYFDPTVGVEAVKILPGEYYVSEHQERMIVTTLGSCISACIRDTKLGIGGMNHFMLPFSDDGQWAGVSSSARYGNFAMEHLINDILKRGGTRMRLEAKIFGGGIMYGDNKSMNVGENNIAFAREYLRTEHIMIAAEDVGDRFSRKVYFQPGTGKVVVKRLSMLKNDTIEEREKAYSASLTTQPIESEIELF